MNYFVTGIGTNVGKTIVSAILTEALEADYWKPVQSGTIEGSDSVFVKSMISNLKTQIHPEAYSLKEPLSPHFAAKLENVNIELEKIVFPETTNNLVVEGAGGLLVPLNQTCYVIDIARQFDCGIVLVISNYLGCINHALLSIDYLLKHQFKIHALVFNGEFEAEVKDVIVAYKNNLKIINIPVLSNLTKHSIKEVASSIVL